jgi:NO-binding membrane sensor protein with MHYT domain
MFRVYTCLTVDHDWRLVVLAGAVCFLASAVAISLFHRAQASMGRARLVWLSLDAGRGRLRHLGNSLHRDARL